MLSVRCDAYSFTLSFVGLVHRKVFMVTLICGIWIIGGIVNFVVTGFRHTPFTAQDFRLVKYALNVAPVYLTVGQIVLIIVLAVILLFRCLYGGSGHRSTRKN